MIPSVLASQLKNGIGEYLENSYPMTNPPFRGSVRSMLDTTDFLTHEPYLSVRLPFRVAEKMPDCFEAIHPQYLPYVHQQRAFDRLTGDDGISTLVATGTGSGKTECFLYPILEYCYQHRMEKGIKALIIYPMNALASDQARRIAGLIYNSPELRGNVTAGMYVGGHGKDDSRVMTETSIIVDHETLLDNPPDILLTNYKMLDYLLIRPKDTVLWNSNGPETLKYIAVDEMHTFDGAQGTDLACLLRRLKFRLGIQSGYLCCIGTSATMGSGESGAAGIVKYAAEIFGEPFERDSIITEDRLTPQEFLAGMVPQFYSMPDADQVSRLTLLTEEDDIDAYLDLALEAWFPELSLDLHADEDRITLGSVLMRHRAFQAVLHQTRGAYIQAGKLAEELSGSLPALQKLPDPAQAIYSLYALISHARTGSAGHLRPFLFVQVQLWIRELARLMARVDPKEVVYSLSNDLNRQQIREYLPVVNCRDCGMTGWVSKLNPNGDAMIKDLDGFYNQFFGADESITMLFPAPAGKTMPGMIRGHICPKCLHVKASRDSNTLCPNCAAPMVPVLIPSPLQTTGGDRRRYICPCCGSHRGLGLMGMRTATEISANLSQAFSSRFNDDKKILAFSDSVQDAAHRAGFFNSRTWSFGLRTAIQTYCREKGSGQSLAEFQDGFLTYWHEKMKDEDFLSFFIAPNMTWRRVYEDMIRDRKLKSGQDTNTLLFEVDQRLKYEILLEYGLSARFGRSLSRCGCSTLSFRTEEIQAVAEELKKLCDGKLQGMDTAEEDASEPLALYRTMVVKYLNRLRSNGAFADPVFEHFTASGNTYLLSNDQNRWLPGLQSGRNTPRFLTEQVGRGTKQYNNNFDSMLGDSYTDLLASCWKGRTPPDDVTLAAVSTYIRDICLAHGILVRMPSHLDYITFGLSKDHVYVSDKVVSLRCSDCGTPVFVSQEELPDWLGSGCMRAHCGGILEQDPDAGHGYFGRLYTTGDMARINAREHTGLLERDDREELEADFKRDRGSQALWDPNVLSCTPTLEMGIDIGDLSTVILCSTPPGQSQFLQRAGRAGRKDGNALTLNVANARPHDLYFYAEPMDMIAGEVQPPHIFLKASAVLERQFTAFCLDSWVKQVRREDMIPVQLGPILSQFSANTDHKKTLRDDVFPRTFLRYIQSNSTRLLNSFQQMFAGDLDEGTRRELQTFVRGEKGKGALEIRILDAFQLQRMEQAALQKSVKDLTKYIQDLKAKPKDSSYEQEIRELEIERNGLLSVLNAISKKNTFNFLSDEGLIPNYAFPEAGIVLRAILYRKDEQQETPGKENVPAVPGKQSKPNSKFSRETLEISRPAISAISEFAPNNSFYVDGRRLTIDQVDLTTAKPESWRLCPNCSHARLEVKGQAVGSCPRCGSTGWAQTGQLRTMLPVRMVYSNADYTKTLVNDSSEERVTAFYVRQLLVDVDEDHDIERAFDMSNEDFPFGYEFVRKASLREINFGEKDSTGERLTVSGQEEVRKGFRVCKYCGKVQPGVKPDHSRACKAKKDPTLDTPSAYEQCMFLFREFETELLRLLIPATTLDPTEVKVESFVAAFMLGMKEYFGNVDHLRATVTEVPDAMSGFRRQYLVIYDTVPGGTGYLKQLLQNENALVDVFAKALAVMENCSCKDDPQKDGCYHCLYAYRQSRKIGSISRKSAISMFRSILSGKDQIKRIPRLGALSINPLVDSELERMFVWLMRQTFGESKVSDSIVHGKHGYFIKAGEQAWEMEPQVDVGPQDGVSIPSRPDFVLWPIRDTAHRPVAVFVDGFQFHRGIVDDDTRKREAIRRSGNFRVWSLSYKDVKTFFSPEPDYCTETLDPIKMPSGPLLYQATAKATGAAGLSPSSLSSFELLLKYLSMPDAETVFCGQAKAYGCSLLDPQSVKNRRAFEAWYRTFAPALEQAHFSDCTFPFPGTCFGVWYPGGEGSYLSILSGVPVAEMGSRKVAVCAILQDDTEEFNDQYQKDWNGFWRFHNVMQFSDLFAGVSVSGLQKEVYLAIPVPVVDLDDMKSEPSDRWDPIFESLFDNKALDFAHAAQKAGVPAPDEDGIGYEVTDESGRVIASVEIAWADRNIGFVLEEQQAGAEQLRALGWTIVSMEQIPVLANLLGGES